MNQGLRTAPRTGRLVRSLALTSVLLLGATACSGGDSDPSKDAATTVAPDAKKALKALNAGLEAHAAGDLTAAVDDYNEALEYDATNEFAFYNLALIDEANGNYGLAEENYRAALDAEAEYEPALFNLAILRTARSDTDGSHLAVQARRGCRPESRRSMAESRATAARRGQSEGWRQSRDPRHRAGPLTAGPHRAREEERPRVLTKLARQRPADQARMRTTLVSANLSCQACRLLSQRGQR